MEQLTVELVPRTCWYSNLRSELPKRDWDILRKAAYAEADYHCVLCGGVGPKYPVEAHERWEYDDDRHVQTLVGIMAICQSCHQVKHFGRTQVTTPDHGKAALAHLADVNGWSLAEATEYVAASFDTWSERSQYEWELDLSWLASQGVPLPERTR